VFVSWCCSLADGVEDWLSSGSGILSFVRSPATGPVWPRGFQEV
jgi:hypothetical protein